MADFIAGTHVLVRNDDGRILMVQEGKEHVKEKWDFPGGGLEHDEDVKQCAEREVEEETGLKVEATGFYTVYLENSQTREVPAIGFLIETELLEEDGEKNHDFEGEILDHGFFSEKEIRELELRKDNRVEILEDVIEKEPVDIDRLKDTRNYMK